MTPENSDKDLVGPVLQSCELTQAIVKAIQASNVDVKIIDKLSYVRVLVPKRCILERNVLEDHLGKPIAFPTDLELVMSSFRGVISISDDQVSWEVK